MGETSTERHRHRVRRARERVDRALVGFDYGPAYSVSDGEWVWVHVDCKRCAASVRAVDRNPWLHWRTHHPLRARLWEMLWRARARPTTDAKPVDSRTPPTEQDAP